MSHNPAVAGYGAALDAVETGLLTLIREEVLRA